jgi:hypothetical protein
MLAAAAGCQLVPLTSPQPACKAPAETAEGGTIRVKAPPQKIIIEQAQGGPAEAPWKPVCAPEAGKQESGKGKPESAPERGKPESAPRRETAEQRPEAEAGGESVAGTLAALGQIASLSRTTAMTRPLGTVNPGSSALGIGITWVHIPIPLPRLFSVDETPSVTVPLTEANLMPYGYGTGLSDAALANALAAQQQRVSGSALTPKEIAAMVAREMAAQEATAPRRETRAAYPPPDDAERQRLEKKLSVAEAQIERLSEALKFLDKKLPAANSGPDK